MAAKPVATHFARQPEIVVEVLDASRELPVGKIWTGSAIPGCNALCNEEGAKSQILETNARLAAAKPGSQHPI